MKNVLTVYGDRSYPLNNPVYAKNSILRGYSGLSDFLAEFQMNNEGITVYSASFSSIQMDDMKTIFLAILYSGEITWLGKFALDDFEKREYNRPYENVFRVTL